MTQVPYDAENKGRLKRLLKKVRLTEGDYLLASQSLRRIETPLRLTIFGTDAEYAVPLLNLLIGQPVVSPAMKRARVQFFYSEATYAKLHYRDGRQERLEGHEFRRLFEDGPSRVRVYLDLPVLKRMSILLALDHNPKALCADAGKTLGGADIAIWTGDLFTDGMRRVWGTLPVTLRDHSYLALAQRADLAPWDAVEREFVKVLRVNPIRAYKAKNHPDGPDREAFRAAGGTLIIKTMKSEIDMLVRAAEDASELLLSRYAAALDALPEHAPDLRAPTRDTPEKPEMTARVVPDPDELPSLDEFDPALVRHIQPRPRPVSNSGARANSEARSYPNPFPDKNMPVRKVRPISKIGAKARMISQRTRSAAAPGPGDP